MPEKSIVPRFLIEIPFVADRCSARSVGTCIGRVMHTHYATVLHLGTVSLVAIYTRAPDVNITSREQPSLKQTRAFSSVLKLKNITWRFFFYRATTPRLFPQSETRSIVLLAFTVEEEKFCQRKCTQTMGEQTFHRNYTQSLFRFCTNMLACPLLNHFALATDCGP